MREIILGTILALGTTLVLQAQANYQVKSFKMSVAGTSTLHAWESSVNRVSAKGVVIADDSNLQGIRSLQVEVDAKSIVSTKGRVMDNKTWEALKADQYPKIVFKVSRVESITRSGATFVVKTTGDLSIAGVTRSIPLEARAKLLPDGDVEFSGSSIIVLSDYNIEQPTALMGTIKVGKEVTVRFSVLMSASGVQ